jgi:dihydroxyacetone kinase-like protein
MECGLQAVRVSVRSQGAAVVKKLINDPRAVVDESVEGFGIAHADLVTVHPDPLFITRRGAPVQGKVGIVSGGGSGHEPLHAGFVGRGMLDAAVPGAVFTSPTPDQIIPATSAVDGGAGVLHIVKNYTGDVLNFETAAEMAEADGVTVRSVLVDDDVAVEDSLYTAGRRGVGGTVFVERIAGAAAERGDDLDGVADVAQRVVDGVRSMGVARRTRSRSASVSTGSPDGIGSPWRTPTGSRSGCSTPSSPISGWPRGTGPS